MSARTARVSGGGQKVRQSGIELLRILAMMLIIMHHLIYFSCGQKIEVPFSSGREVLFAGFCGFGKVGVAIFFLITGYFLYGKKSAPKPKRVIPIIRQALFYLLLAIILSLLLFPDKMKLSFPLSGLPLSFTQIFTAGCYWFIGAYALFMLLSPQIKKMLDSLSDRDLTKLCLVIVLTVTVGSEIMRLTSTGVGITFFTFPSVITYTLIGYTIRRREKDIKSCKWAVLALLAGAFLIMLTPVIAHFYANRGWGDETGLFSRDQASGTLLMSVGALIIFSRMKWKNRAINYIASTTLGVYLAHNNPFVSYMVLGSSSAIGMWIAGLFFGYNIFFSILMLIILTIDVFSISCVVEIIRRLAVKVIIKVCTIEKVV